MNARPTLALRRVPGRYAVHRLPPDAPWPDDLPPEGMVSLTRTPDEVSIVAPEPYVPPGATTEDGWTAFAVDGPLAFEQTGIVAALADAAARAGVPVFVVSTYDTDWILVPESRGTDAATAWRAAGHQVD